MDSSEEERVATRRESSPTRRDNANSPVRGDNNEEPYGQEQQAAWGEEEDAVNDKKRRGSRSVTRTPSASPRRGDSYDRNRGDNDDDAPTSLLVRHLRFTTSPTAVRRYFEQIGEVKDVYLPLEYETGRPRGFGFVEFVHARDAAEAQRVLNDTELQGARISISVAQHGRKTPSVMRTRSGGYHQRRGPSRSGGYRREPYSAPGGDRYRSPPRGGYNRYEDRRGYDYGRRDRDREGYRSGGGDDRYGYRTEGGYHDGGRGGYRDDYDSRDRRY